MRRTFTLLVAGALLGAAAMYFVRGTPETGDPEAAPGSSPVPAPAAATASAPRAPAAIDFLMLATGSVSTAERAALLDFAAQADRRTLESLATQVAALPNIEGRRVALEALFTRYAVLDARAAAAFARSLDLPPDALRPVFTEWARADPRGALQALGELAPQAALTVGVAMLDVLGNDDLGIARVLGAAPRLDADRFRIEAAVAKAAHDPRGALDDALLLPPTKASAALERIAVIYGEADVHGALGAAERIADDALRNEFRNAIMRTWVRTNPEAVVDYVVELDAEELQQALRSGAVQAFALIEPERALRAADAIPGELGRMIRRAALLGLARDDPLAAIALLDSQPEGDREQMLTSIAASYGRVDPEGALAWARSLMPPSPGALANALAGLARVDPERAIALAFDEPPGDRQRAFMSMIMNNTVESGHAAAIADSLLATPAGRRELQTVTQMWAQRQPRDALQWLLAHPDPALEGAIGAAGIRLAHTDPGQAVRLTAGIPQELRAGWISSVAAGYAQNDPHGAASWIAQFRGEPGYAAAVAAVASQTAWRDAPAAARLLDSIDLAEAPDAPQAAISIASSWARQNAGAAAAWAASLPDEAARTAAVNGVAIRWVERDAAAARGWALTLRAGEARDAALTQIVGATATTGGVDQTLLDAYSSPQAREQGIGQAVRAAAQRDPAAARRLVEEHLTDPRARRSAEQFLDRGGGNVPLLGPPPPRLPQQR